MKNIFTRTLAFMVSMIVTAFAVVGKSFELYVPLTPDQMNRGSRRHMAKQGGFVLLGKNYMGYASGTIVELPASTEAALIASGQAQDSAGPATAGAVSTTANSGNVTIAAGQSSLTVTHPTVTSQSQISAVVNQAAADGTLLRVERIVCAAGSFTIYGTANATAAVRVKWAILNPNGSLTGPI